MRLSKLFTFILLLVSFLFTGLAQPKEPFAIRTFSENGVVYSTSQVQDTGLWFVLPKDKKEKKNKVKQVLNENKFEVIELENINTFLVRFPQDEAYKFKRKFFEEGLVAYFDHDNVISVSYTPDDPLWGQQWDMVNINMPAAWDLPQPTSGEDIIVAVVDTGIDSTHPDLINNLYFNSAGNSGWESFNGVLKESKIDYHGHGTHCAGTIAATGNNAVGMAGMNLSKVKLMSFAFLGANGSGNSSDAAILFNKIITLKKEGLNIRITSNSWGGGGANPELRNALIALEENNILTVAAAGNNASNTDIYYNYPSTYPLRGIISVQAHDVNNASAYFSNYGLTTTDVSAPGVSTLSTLPTNPNLKLNNPSGYGNLSGTSMACPHVSGQAAFLLSFNPNLTVYELKDLILNKNSVTVGSGRMLASTTSGRIDVSKSLSNPLLYNPRTNNLPILTGNSSRVINAGESITVHAQATDADGDALQYFIGGAITYRLSQESIFTGPYYPFDSTFTVYQGVADGNGGSSLNSFCIDVLTNPTKIYDDYGVSAEAVLNNVDGATAYKKIIVNTQHTFKTDPAVPTYWRVKANTRYSSSGSYHPGLIVGNGISGSLFVPTNYWYNISAPARNAQYLNKESNKIIMWSGDSAPTDEPPQFPTLSVKLSNFYGKTPLTVYYDCTESISPNGQLKGVYIFKPGSGAATLHPLKGSFVVSQIGIGSVDFYISDPKEYTDSTQQTISVTGDPTEIPECISPSINQQPSSLARQEGLSASFSVIAGGTAPFTYQWRFNGVNIPNATSSTYVINYVKPSDSGSYSVLIFNGCGVALSEPASLSVLPCTPPSISSQPVSQTRDVGQSVTFSASVIGSATLSYQWHFNGTPIAGAISRSYTISSVKLTDAGSYYLVARNSCGAATSLPATLTVNQCNTPFITTHPTSQVRTVGQSVSFSVLATGSSPFSYQWRFNENIIVGATSSTYVIQSVQATHAGSYTVLVSNPCGSAISNSATLTVNPICIAPTIITSPASQTSVLGQPVTFSVSSSGTTPVAYQWRFNNTPISGATGPSYTIDAVQLTNAGDYSVSISNACGSITSPSAILTISDGVQLNQVLNLAAISDGNTIKLTWTDNSNLEEGYEIWMSTKFKNSTSPYAKVAVLPANSSNFSYIVTSGTGPQWHYSFQIRAYSGSRFAPWSNIVQTRVR